MESLVVEFMQLFGVSRPLAILKMFELFCLFTAAPIIIYTFVRVGFHSMHFDVLKDDVNDAKKHAATSATQADKAVGVSYKIYEKVIEKD